MNIKEELLLILKNETQAKIDVEQLNHNVSILTQGVDSLDFNSFLLSVEENYNIEILEEEIENLESINLLVEYIKKNREDC